MIRLGMIGGGEGAFIGAVHRIALSMDGAFRLTAGAFSSDPANSRRTGEKLGLAANRVYDSLDAMLTAEAALPASERIEAVAIVTPNHLHVAQAKAALLSGFHVICDKPLGVDLAEAESLQAVAAQSGKVFVLTHNYAGYPMIREARERILRGELGEIRKVYAEYLQGWLAEPLEASGHKQAAWRTDPKRSGPTGALGDIGTHAFHLAEHVTGLRVARLYARLCHHVPGRALDDDAMLLLEFHGGASGSLAASQVCFGRENGLSLRVYGTKGAFSWGQEEPNTLYWTGADGAVRLLRSATAATGEASRSLTRTPPGHPEGYLEGFANIYRAAARKIRGEPTLDEAHASLDDGLRGLRFLSAAVASSSAGEWRTL